MQYPTLARVKLWREGGGDYFFRPGENLSEKADKYFRINKQYSTAATRRLSLPRPTLCCPTSVWVRCTSIGTVLSIETSAVPDIGPFYDGRLFG